jgi:trehalose 6-phosphate phosphatase
VSSALAIPHWAAMKDILLPPSQPVLAHFAASNTLLALDFDGTLAPIVEDRSRAQMRPITRSLLARACALFPCAVISGRARNDVVQRLDGIPVPHIIGNHGLEPLADMARFEAWTKRTKFVLERELHLQRDLELEDKRYSLAIHYRKADSVGTAWHTIMAALACLHEPYRLIGGKSVVNVLAPNSPDKALALEVIRAEARADLAIYVGDDDTDEVVFDASDPQRVLGIRVEPSERSSAPYFVTGQGRIDALLHALVVARIRSRE